MSSHHVIDIQSLYIPIVVDLILVFVAGKIAQGKGESYYKYFLIGALLPVVGLIVALLIPGKGERGNEQDKAKALREYKTLLDDGAITQEEYDAKKKELMS